MKSIITSVLFSLILFAPCYAQYEKQNRALDEFIKKGMAIWNIPGMATVVVQDGKVVFQKTYGVKNLHKPEKVNAQTMFSMASTTKAITAIALGMLVDRKKLGWQDKVIKHIPEFKVGDPYVTQNARVVDLLTHNLGFKNTDKIWVWDSLSNKDAIQRYSHAKPVYSMRGGYGYQNMMYIVASEVIERASGMDWKTFIEKNLFEPLDMQNSALRAKELYRINNYVSPHINDPEEDLIPIPLNFSEQVGAAGCIWSSIEDMGKYISFLTNRGATPSGRHLLKPATFDYLFRSHVIVSPTAYSTYKVIKPEWHTYGLGWFQLEYRQEKMCFHTGSLAGLNAITGIIPSKKTAVYFFANRSSANLRHAVLYKVMDLYAFNDFNGRDWLTLVQNLYGTGDNAGAKKRAAARDRSRVKGTSLKHPLKDYAGTFRHEMFGDIHVVVKDGKMKIDHNNYIFYTATHWHYESFISSKNEQWRYRVFFKFRSNRAGKVTGLYYDGPHIDLLFNRVEE